MSQTDLYNLILESAQGSERLDELKKETLGSYIKIAADKIHNQSYDKGVASILKMPENQDYATSKLKKRREGIKSATDKLMKGQYQESVLDKLAEALEFLDEEQVDYLADVVLEMLDEGIDLNDYAITTEPGLEKFGGGHRAKIIHRKTKKLMYLSGDHYDTIDKAKLHAKAYLHGYYQGGPKRADEEVYKYRKSLE